MSNWLKDAGLDDPDTLPPPDEIAAEIAESLEAALARFPQRRIPPRVKTGCIYSEMDII